MTAVMTRKFAVDVKKSPTEDAVLVLWRKYEESHLDTDRNRLIEHYLPFVKFLATRICLRLPKNIGCEECDIESAGIFGLVDSIDAFDLSRGIKFETFSSIRIRWSIVDMLRNMDHVSRVARGRENQLSDFCRCYYKKHGELPVPEEIQKGLNLLDREWKKILASHKIARVTIASLDDSFGGSEKGGFSGDRNVSRGDILKDGSVIDPKKIASENIFFDELRKIFDRREYLILVLYYRAGMTMSEISGVIGLSEGRISQKHNSILSRLKARFS